jgi:hypothetical protein
MERGILTIYGAIYMKTEQVVMTAFAGKEKERSLTIELPVPENLTEAVDMFTEKVVFDVFKAQYIIKAQAAGRGQLALEVKETGLAMKTDEDVVEYMKQWKLTGGNRSKLSPQERLKRAGKGMSKEELLALIADMDEEEFLDDEPSEDEIQEDSGE